MYVSLPLTLWMVHAMISANVQESSLANKLQQQYNALHYHKHHKKRKNTGKIAL